jgi:hypothetical protein
MVILSSCSVERSDIGRLEGLWQLYRVDTIATGGCCDLRQSQLAWAFQGKLLELRSHPYSYLDFIASYSMTTDSLYIDNLRLLDREHGDPLLSDADSVRCFGVNKTNEHFRVLHFSDELFQLQSDRLVIYLRKY